MPAISSISGFSAVSLTELKTQKGILGLFSDNLSALDGSSNSNTATNDSTEVKDKLTLSLEATSNRTNSTENSSVNSQIGNNSNKNKATADSTATQNNSIKESKTDNTTKSDTKKSKDGRELKPEEKRAVEDLIKTDRNVRTHESAHEAAGGSLVRGKSFSYVTGPDGQQYAVGGEVSIDMSTVSNNPSATIQKMQQVRRAALAPSDPSSQDRSVATTASTIEESARAEQIKNSSMPTQEKSSNSNSQQANAVNSYIKYSGSDSKNSTGTIFDAVNSASSAASLKLFLS